MALKLEEFRLKSYQERSALQHALQYLRSNNPGDYPEEVHVLLIRLSRTQCQPGGCRYCGGPEESDDAS